MKPDEKVHAHKLVYKKFKNSERIQNSGCLLESQGGIDLEGETEEIWGMLKMP